MLKYPSVQISKGKAVASAELISANKQHAREGQIRSRIKTSSGATLKTIISQAGEHYTLKWKEFLCFAFIWEMPLFQVVNYIDLILENGGMVVFLGYFAFSMCVGMPIYMLLLFWGTYTKRGYIKLWEMVPILKGMAWSVSVFSIFLELFNISIGGLALVYITDLFNAKLPWADCGFEEATDACYPMFPNESYTKTCNPGKQHNIINFPAYEYFLRNKIHAPLSSADYKGFGQLQVPWAMSVSFTWFIIFLLLTLGFQRYRTTINNTAFVFAFIFSIPTFGFTIFNSRDFPRPSFMASDHWRLIDAEFWITILTHSFSRKVPGNYVVLGSHAPKNMVPNLNVFCIYGMKYVCFLCLMIWLSNTVQLVQLHYQVKDINCIPITGLSLVFAIIPDIFTRFPTPHLSLLLYFSGLWFFGLLSALYTMNAFCESVTEAFPGIFNYRLYFHAILCTICCLLNMSLLTNLYFAIMETWTVTGFTYITTILMLAFAFAMFLYSVRKYGNDYCFMHGKLLPSFWTHGVKINLLVSLLFLILILSSYLKFKWHYPTSTLVSIFCYLLMAIILVPAFFVATGIYMKYKNKGKAGMAVTPTSEWGPPSSSDKQLRSRFNPKREVRIKDEVQRCRHNCLLNSQQIKHEIRTLQMNRLRLTTSIGMVTSEEELL